MTQGFDINNLSGHTLKLISVVSAQSTAAAHTTAKKLDKTRAKPNQRNGILWANFRM